MKLKKLSVVLLTIVSIIAVLALSGCPGPQRRPAPPPPNATPGPAPGVQDLNQDLEQVDPRGMDPGQVPPRGAQDVNDGVQEARRLSTMINMMPEVNSSSVIISGDMAIVGLDLKANLNTQRIDAIKAEVTRKVKRANNRIDNVTVTADADTVTRIRRVADGLRQGRPISSFAQEMADIMNRLAPTNR